MKKKKQIKKYTEEDMQRVFREVVFPMFILSLVLLLAIFSFDYTVGILVSIITIAFQLFLLNRVGFI